MTYLVAFAIAAVLVALGALVMLWIVKGAIANAIGRGLNW